MEWITPIFEGITGCLHILSIAILVWGVVISAKDFFVSRVTIRNKCKNLEKLTEIKNVLGGYVLLSLEILIVADIIDSILKPTFEDILKLAAIVAIRTVISYFLNKEIREAENANQNKAEDENAGQK